MKGLLTGFIIINLLVIPLSAQALEYTAIGDIRIDLDGFIRARGMTFSTEGQNDPQFFDGRVLLITKWQLNEHISFHFEIDGLKNVLAGKNEGGNLFSQDTSIHEHERPFTASMYRKVRRHEMEDTLELSRLWMEVWFPCGLLGVGRMPGHWGQGVLINEGIDFEDDFGDTYDRIYFQSKPIGGIYSPYRVYGMLSQISEGVLERREDDLWEGALATTYDTENMDAGLMVGYRWRPDNPHRSSRYDDLQLFFADIYFNYSFGPFSFATECYYMTADFDLAKTDTPGSEQIEDINGKSVGFTMELEADWETWFAGISGGFQIGADPNNIRFDQGHKGWTGATYGLFGFAPDYHVDLIMFREALAAVTDSTVSPFDDTLGAINNAYYYRAAGGYRCHKTRITTELAFIKGMLDETGVYETFGDSVVANKDLGWEIDLSIWYNFPVVLDHVKCKLGILGAYFKPGNFFTDFAVYNGDDTGPTGGVSWFDLEDMYTLQGWAVVEF